MQATPTAEELELMGNMLERVRTLCRTAAEANLRIMIDAEHQARARCRHLPLLSSALVQYTRTLGLWHAAHHRRACFGPVLARSSHSDTSSGTWSG